jgi:hypothetical protein
MRATNTKNLYVSDVLERRDTGTKLRIVHFLLWELCNRRLANTQPQRLFDLLKLPALGRAGKKSVMPYAHKALGKYMHRKTAYKLHGVKLHALFLALFSVVFVGKGDMRFAEVLQPMIADGDFVRVPSKVFHHLLGPPNGCFE